MATKLQMPVGSVLLDTIFLASEIDVFYCPEHSSYGNEISSANALAD